MIQTPYFFSKEGRIVRGEYLGWIVEIVDDTQGETGGYYILVNNGQQDSLEAFDWWLETREEILIFIHDMNWVIEWTE